MTETKTATRYTPDEAVLIESLVEIPDSERDYTCAYPGWDVTLPDSTDVVGHLWFDGTMFCWKTPTASAYGRHEVKRYAIAALLGVVQQ